jgi:hypothetical protein
MDFSEYYSSFLLRFTKVGIDPMLVSKINGLEFWLKS